MASLNDILTIARSGILSHQERLATISHNIANVDTEGFHKRRLSLQTGPSLAPSLSETRRYEIGSGVTVADVVRTYDQAKENMLNEQISDSQYHDQMSQALSDIEALLTGDGDATLHHQLHEFWSAWQDISVRPESIAARSVLIEKGAALTGRFRNLSEGIQKYRSRIASGSAPSYSGVIQNEVDEINNLASELQELNYRISYKMTKYEPHDLMDRRDVVLRELSSKAGVEVSSDFTVSLDGQMLVNSDGSALNTLSITDINNPAQPAIRFSLDGANVDIDRGSLGAWVDVTDTIDSVQEELNTMASELMTEVNNIHNSTAGNAYDLDGNLSIIDFFTGTNSSDIEVNSVIHDSSNPMNDDPRIIAAADSPSPGNGAKALEIADVAYSRIGALGNQTLSDYFASLTTSIASAIESESDLAADGNAVAQMLTDSIQNETGVSLDEELIEMTAAQRAYQASLRVFSNVDSLMDLVIRMGA